MTLIELWPCLLTYFTTLTIEAVEWAQPANLLGLAFLWVHGLGPPTRCNLSHPVFGWAGSPTKVDYRKNSTPIRSSLLEDLVVQTSLRFTYNQRVQSQSACAQASDSEIPVGARKKHRELGSFGFARQNQKRIPPLKLQSAMAFIQTFWSPGKKRRKKQTNEKTGQPGKSEPQQSSTSVGPSFSQDGDSLDGLPENIGVDQMRISVANLFRIYPPFELEAFRPKKMELPLQVSQKSNPMRIKMVAIPGPCKE